MKTTHSMSVFGENLTCPAIQVKKTKKSILEIALKWIVTLLGLNVKYGVVKWLNDISLNSALPFALNAKGLDL